MKVIPFIAIVWSIAISAAIANASLYLKASRIDGLPSRLLELGVLGKGLASSHTAIDLAQPFREIGCNIEDGCTIIYHPGTGMLIRNLDENSHKIVDEFLDGLYRVDNLLATSRAYCELLEPLSTKDRLQTVMRIGFLPDPLVASMIDQIRRLKPIPNVAVDPFAKADTKPRQLSNEEVERIARLEKATSLILDIALERLRKQVAAMDVIKAESAGSAQPATQPADKAPAKEQPSTPTSKDASR